MSGHNWKTERPVRRGQVWIQRESRDTALYDAETGHLHMLNPSALAIWELCDGSTTPAEMAESISEITELSYDAAWADVVATLENLRRVGLIE